MVDNNMLVTAMMASWASFGVVIDKIADNFDIYISVPEHAEHLDVNGKEMAGKHLAFRMQEVLREMTHKKIVIRYKVRDGEYWTNKMANEAMSKSIKDSDPLSFLEDV